MTALDAIFIFSAEELESTYAADFDSFVKNQESSPKNHKIDFQNLIY